MKLVRSLLTALFIVAAVAPGALQAQQKAPAAKAAPAAEQSAPLPASTPDETARWLAGMAPKPGSSLAARADDPVWKAHAKALDAEWTSLEARQLAKVRAFAAANLKSPSKTLFYAFSGPDFVYANAFFPAATTYVLAGLEPVGPIPDIAKLKPDAARQSLAHLRTSIHHLIGFSYFITLDMDQHLRRGTMPGVLPVLYAFMARSGMTVRSAEHVRLMPDGKVVPFVADAANPKDTARAAKITFAGADNVEKTLYFFSTNLEDKAIGDTGFLKFTEGLGTGDAFVKSASYLMHGSAFSSVRNFLLAKSRHILQDDSGIAMRYFDDKAWTLTPFGRYTTPIPTFSGNFQPALKKLFETAKPAPFDFSLGYRWRPGQSNLMLATKK